jgi:hypothetical protein
LRSVIAILRSPRYTRHGVETYLLKVLVERKGMAKAELFHDRETCAIDHAYIFAIVPHEHFPGQFLGQLVNALDTCIAARGDRGPEAGNGEPLYASNKRGVSLH